MKLSIVIPAYNVEQYIGRCFDSIFNQQIETDMLEVIVVNDGSKDGTEDIIKQYASQHPNLIYISQENQGQSVARNIGLKRATGDLIWYVDSDDATTENSIQTIFSYFKKYPHADFLTFNWINLYVPDGSKRFSKSWGEKKMGIHLKKKNNIYEKPFDGFAANARLIASVPWFHVFKREYLLNHNLFFSPGLLHEDDELCMRLCFFAKEVRFIPFAHYIYSAMRPGSLTTVNHTFTMKSVDCSLKTIEIWKKFEQEFAYNSKQVCYINKFIKYKYQRLVLLAARKKDIELNHLYLKHKNEWRKGYKDSYKKSISIKNFSVVDFLKYLVVLYCPQYYKYTELSTLKRIIKGNS